MNNIKTIFNIPRFIVHLFLFVVYYDRCIDDLLRECKTPPPYKLHVYWRFLYLMTNHKYFRGTFYHRIGKLKHLCSFLAPCAHDFVLGSMPIGPGFNAAHSFSTVVNAKSVGKNCTVFQDVTIGFSKDGCPTIGDNVTIYANSVVVGSIKIGNNVTIAACTFVNKDVPDNCLAIGVPAVIKPKKGT